MTPILVNVVITTFNRPVWLERAIRSVLNQDFPNTRIFILDNGDSESTAKLISEKFSLIKDIYHQPNHLNIGSIANIVKAFSFTDSDYFVYLSDDDMLEEAFLARSIQILTRYNHCEFLVTPARLIDANGTVIRVDKVHSGIKVHPPSIHTLKAIIKGRIPYKWSGILFRSRILSVPQLINEKLGPFLDSHFVLALSAKYYFIQANYYGAAYTVHRNSQSEAVRLYNRHWPAWWAEAAKLVEGDPSVDVDIRHRYRRLITPRFYLLASSQILSLVKRGDFSNSEKIIHEYSEGVSNKYFARGFSLLAFLINRLARAAQRRG